MNEKDWNNLSFTEKYQELMSGSMQIEKQAGIDGNSKVGDAKVTTYYRVRIDNVFLNAWDSSLVTALREAATALEGLELQALEEVVK